MTRLRALLARHPDALTAVIGGVVVSAVANWPFVAHLGQRLPATSPDAFAESWAVAWAGHALIHAPGHLFQGNVFWPEPDALAHGDALIGYAPVTWVAGLVLAYGLLFLFSYALAFAGAFLLGRELGASRPGAVVGGVAFACAPWRLSQVNHLHVLSSGGIPLTLFLLLRGYRQSDWRLILAGWIVASWQVTIGFALGLQLLYLLLALGVAALVWHFARGRRLVRGVKVATVAGVVCLATVTVVMGSPYARTVASLPQAPGVAARHYSAPVKGLLVAPSESEVWGFRAVSLRESLPAPGEQSLFLGLVILGLALAGAVAGPIRRTTRIGLAGGAVFTLALALGYGVLDGWLGYRELSWLPGWEGVRVPGRLMTLVTLALALLAAAGVDALAAWAASRRRWARGWAVAAACAVVVVAEGYGPPGGARVLPAPAMAAAPVLHLPAHFSKDPLYMFWSAETGFPPTVNGASTAIPPSTLRTYRAVQGFPDRRSVAYLRALGVRTVELHPRLAVATPWQGAAKRSIRGLGVTRHVAGGDVFYDLRK